MDYKIIEAPEFKILGKSRNFKFKKFVKEAPKFWKEYVGSKDYQDLLGLTDGRPGLTTNATLLSVYFPKENGNRDEFIDVLAVETSIELESKKFDVYTIPAATYAEFNCTYKSSMKTNRYIYGEWFSSTGHERDGDLPDIVSYFPIPFRPMNEMLVRWWGPVQSK